jgi:hypothetical protein
LGRRRIPVRRHGNWRRPGRRLLCGEKRGFGVLRFGRRGADHQQKGESGQDWVRLHGVCDPLRTSPLAWAPESNRQRVNPALQLGKTLDRACAGGNWRMVPHRFCDSALFGAQMGGFPYTDKPVSPLSRRSTYIMAVNVGAAHNLTGKNAEKPGNIGFYGLFRHAILGFSNALTYVAAQNNRPFAVAIM